MCYADRRLYGRGALDLLPYLEPDWRAELAHALTHLSLRALLRQITGARWFPIRETTTIDQKKERE